MCRKAREGVIVGYVRTSFPWGQISGKVCFVNWGRSVASWGFAGVMEVCGEAAERLS